MLYSSGEVFPCTCTRVYVGIPRFFYIRLSTNPHRLYTKKICHCKICKIRMVIVFIAIFRTLLNACSPGVIHNFTKKGKKISTAISACKQASAGYIHRITEVMHHNCAHFVDNFYLLMHIKKKPYLCGVSTERYGLFACAGRDPGYTPSTGRLQSICTPRGSHIYPRASFRISRLSVAAAVIVSYWDNVT